MMVSRSRIALVVLAFVTAACSGTASSPAGSPVTGGGASPSVIQVPPPTVHLPSITPVPSPSGPAAISPLPSGFNACTLLTDAQASAVNGSTYPPGVNHLLNSGFIECVWQTPTPPSSITLQVLSTSGDTSAQEAYAEAEASVQGFSLVTVPNVGDEAQIARAPSGTANTGGIYVRVGSIFFDVVYLNGTGATDAALVTAATLVLGNLH